MEDDATEGWWDDPSDDFGEDALECGNIDRSGAPVEFTVEQSACPECSEFFKRGTKAVATHRVRANDCLVCPGATNTFRGLSYLTTHSTVAKTAATRSYRHSQLKHDLLLFPCWVPVHPGMFLKTVSRTQVRPRTLNTALAVFTVFAWVCAVDSAHRRQLPARRVLCMEITTPPLPSTRSLLPSWTPRSPCEVGACSHKVFRCSARRITKRKEREQRNYGRTTEHTPPPFCPHPGRTPSDQQPTQHLDCKRVSFIHPLARTFFFRVPSAPSILTHALFSHPFSSSHSLFFLPREYVWPEGRQTFTLNLETRNPSHLKSFRIQTLRPTPPATTDHHHHRHTSNWTNPLMHHGSLLKVHYQRQNRSLNTHNFKHRHRLMYTYISKHVKLHEGREIEKLIETKVKAY